MVSYLMSFVVSQYIPMIPFENGVKLMEETIPRAVQQKKCFLFFTQHPLVYTAGSNTRPEHILNPAIQVERARRGGSVTVHNPGQLMIYTVIPLALIPGGLQAHIRHLEYAIIRSLQEYEIHAFSMEPHSGVFTAQGKIAFTGVGLKQGCVFHGAALNFSNNLADYAAIESCGLTLPITNIAIEAPGNVTKLSGEKDFAKKLASTVEKHFSFLYKQLSPTEYREIIENEMPQFAAHKQGKLLHGLMYFNARKFWLAHESWEFWWKRESNPEYKSFLQFLILWASANFKLTEKVNITGAKSLFSKAAKKLPEISRLLAELRVGPEPAEAAFARARQKIHQSDAALNDSHSLRKLFTPCVLTLRDDIRQYEP